MSGVDFASIIGLIVSVLSILGVIYLAGVKVANVESAVALLREWSNDIDDKIDRWDSKVNALSLEVGSKISKLEVMTTTMWDFQMRRAASEAVRKGLADMNSPIVIREEAKQWFASFAGELHQFYQRLGRHLSSTELAMEIERLYGERIFKEVCIPRGLDHGACLLIAIEVAKEIAGESND